MATLEPENSADYKQWRPEGPKLDGSSVHDKDGNALKLKLRLKNLKTKQDVNDKDYDATITLSSSRVPGVAMNYPPRKEAEGGFDLYFKQSANKAKVTGKDEQMLVVTKGRGATDITVTSRDWGGYGTVQALVTVEGAPIEVRVIALGKDAEGPLGIPLDENKNHIADGWEDKAGILGKNYPATWDEEPFKGSTHKGDGYSLYDEYRGFYLQKARSGKVTNRASPGDHVELSPTEVDLLVAVQKSPFEQYGYAGANDYADIGEVKVSFVPDANYLGALPGDVNATYPRQSNFNRSTTDKLDEEQAAVWVVFDERLAGHPGNTPHIAEIPEMSFTAPMFVTGVFVGVDSCKEEVQHEIEFGTMAIDPKYGGIKPRTMQAAIAARGLAPATFTSKATARATALVNELIEFTVFHELGHATGARHHEVVPYAACSRNCVEDSQCADCPLYTATSKRSRPCGVAADPERPGHILNATVTEPFVNDPEFRGSHQMQCYSAENEHIGGGDEACPMRYWHYMDGEAIVKYLLGEWNPAAGPPRGGKWHFCAKENLPSMRLHETAGELLSP